MHIACMGNWQEVLCELQPYLLNLQDQDFHVRLLIAGGMRSDVYPFLMGIYYDVVKEGLSIRDFESPAIQHVYDTACTSAPDTLIAYLHTKGVSSPANANKAGWRRCMLESTFARVDRTVKMMEAEGADCAGWNWQDFRRIGLNKTSISHFSGNFWMARAGYLARLVPFADYYAYPRTADTRTACEFWIGSYDYNGGRHPIVLSLWGWSTDTQDKKRFDWDRCILNGKQNNPYRIIR